MVRRHRRFLRREGFLFGFVTGPLLLTYLGPRPFVGAMVVVTVVWMRSLIFDTNDLPLFAEPEPSDAPPDIEVVDPAA